MQLPRARGSRRGGRAAAAPAVAMAGGEEGSFNKGVAALTNLFPVWVVAAAALGATRPAAFAFFQPSYVTSALAVTMLGMGLTLTFEVRVRKGRAGGRLPRETTYPSLSAFHQLSNQPFNCLLPPQDFKRVLSTPGRIFTGFALQYTIMPLLGYLVSRCLALPLDFTVGCARRPASRLPGSSCC